MDTNLPLVISFIGTILTLGISLWLGIAKQKTENKLAMANADSAFRDDLLALNDRYEKQIEQKEDQIRLRDERLERKNEQLAAAQTIIASQLEKITDLTLTVKQLQYEVQELRAELEKFNRKVFYVRDDRREKKEESHEPKP